MLRWKIIDLNVLIKSVKDGRSGLLKIWELGLMVDKGGWIIILKLWLFGLIIDMRGEYLLKLLWCLICVYTNNDVHRCLYMCVERGKQA